MSTDPMSRALDVIARSALSDVLSDGDDAIQIARLVNDRPSILHVLGGPNNTTPLYEAVAAGLAKATATFVALGAPIHRVESVAPPLPAAPWQRAMGPAQPNLAVLAALIESPVATANDLQICRDDLELLVQRPQQGTYALYARVCARLTDPPKPPPPGGGAPRW